MKKNWSKEVKLVLKGWGYSILVALILATSFKSAVADWNIVPSGSMKPTILEGDRILVNKLAYDLKVPYTTWHIAQWGDPKEGEIVVFNSPAEHPEGPSKSVRSWPRPQRSERKWKYRAGFGRRDVPVPRRGL